MNGFPSSSSSFSGISSEVKVESFYSLNEEPSVEFDILFFKNGFSSSSLHSMQSKHEMKCIVYR